MAELRPLKVYPLTINPLPNFSGCVVSRDFSMLLNTIIKETAHDKTYNETCVTNKDSDQPVHPPSMTRVLVYPSLDSLEAEGTCNQQRLRSDCADAQADLSLRWPHKSYCRFCHALAQIRVVMFKLCLRGIWDLMSISAHA